MQGRGASLESDKEGTSFTTNVLFCVIRFSDILCDGLCGKHVPRCSAYRGLILMCEVYHITVLYCRVGLADMIRGLFLLHQMIAKQ